MSERFTNSQYRGVLIASVAGIAIGVLLIICLQFWLPIAYALMTQGTH